MVIKRPSACFTLKVLDEDRRNLLESVGATEKSVAEAVEIVKLWFKQQPHLPDVELDSARVERLYLMFKTSIDRTKQAVDMTYSMKHSAPEMFMKRDPQSPEFQKMQESFSWTLFPYLTEEGYRVYFFKLIDTQPVVWSDLCKLVLMTLEIRTYFDYPKGEVAIFDMKNLTVANVATLTPGLVKKGLTAIQLLYASRLKGLHFFNAPEYTDTLINLMRMFMTPKLQARITVHTDMESLAKVFPLKSLPRDYDGEEMSLAELQADWNKTRLEWRDWFLEQDIYKSDESRRQGIPLMDELLGIYGSFKKLDVD